jgi:hypothetical protein
MKEKYLPNQKYYNFSTECTCGVIVDEKTMKRIQKVLYKAEAEIKNILHNSDNVRPYDWSLVNIKDGEKIKKQKVFHYPSFYSWDTVENRINNLKLTSPRYMKDFYEIKSEEELEDLKKCLLEELKAEVEE